MSIEVMLLGVLIGLTLLAYLIAINSHGTTRLSISYLIATVLLAGTVYAIVQHVNSGLSREQQQRFSQLEQQKFDAEARAKFQEENLVKNKKMMDAATKINSVITQGIGYSTSLMNIELRDFSVELDVLMGRANAMRDKINQLSTAFAALKEECVLFPESVPIINDALNNLTESARYYGLYYKSEDSAQEDLRERTMRQKATLACDLLKKAGGQIAAGL